MKHVWSGLWYAEIKGKIADYLYYDRITFYNLLLHDVNLTVRPIYVVRFFMRQFLDVFLICQALGWRLYSWYLYHLSSSLFLPIMPVMVLCFNLGRHRLIILRGILYDYCVLNLYTKGLRLAWHALIIFVLRFCLVCLITGADWFYDFYVWFTFEPCAQK